MRQPASKLDTEASLAFRRLAPAEVLGAVEGLGFRTDGRLLALNSYENRVYQVGLEDAEPVVAKFYRPGRWSDETILEEHGFALELAAHEIPVVPPMAHAATTLHRQGHFRFAVYPRRGGRSPELDDFSGLRRIGRLVGRLHSIGASRAFTHRPRIDIASLGREPAAWLLAADLLPAHLTIAYETTARDLLEAVSVAWELAGASAGLRLHGDLHPGNVLARDDQIHLVDLDDCASGPAVQDLWMFLSGDRYEQEPQLAELLAGYTEFRDFDPGELWLVEPLRSLRMIHYASWLARRWSDPAFPAAFPWFGSARYWEDHVLSLREQLALVREPPLTWRDPR
jgi:Ser/Thr protein kinase RdoA (MazF antagonist)